MPREPLESELKHMFREDLIVACQYWGVDLSTSKSGDELTQLLAEKMRDREARERIFATFSDREYDLLGMLCLNGGAMSYDGLKPYRKKYSYGQLNQTERELRKKGIIVRRIVQRVTDLGREVAEFKIIDFFLPHLIQYFSRKPEHVSQPPKRIRNFVNERDSLLVDILVLVSHLATNPVKMTTTWEFPRREIERIKTALSKQTDERFETVQRVARKCGAYVIVEDDKAVPGRIDRLFDGDQAEVSKRILLAALGRTRAIWATPDQPTEFTLNLAICRLRESSEGDWITIEEMKQWIRSELFIEKEPLKWIQVDENRVAIALEIPILLGLLEAAYKGRKLVAVALTQVGAAVVMNRRLPENESRETFFVQPNFEITCFTPEMNYADLYRLMLFTEPVKIDVVSTFRITDRSVFKAVELGMREKDIVEFLESKSSKPVPKNVARSIRDWIGRMTFVKISTVTLLETETERDLEGLLLIRGLEDHVVRRVGPTAVIVSGDVEELVDLLRDNKCHVTRPGETTSPLEASHGTAIAEQVLLYEQAAADDVPEDCMGCPAIQSCTRVLRRKVEKKRRRRVGA